MQSLGKKAKRNDGREKCSEAEKNASLHTEGSMECLRIQMRKRGKKDS